MAAKCLMMGCLCSNALNDFLRNPSGCDIFECPNTTAMPQFLCEKVPCLKLPARDVEGSRSTNGSVPTQHSGTAQACVVRGPRQHFITGMASTHLLWTMLYKPHYLPWINNQITYYKNDGGIIHWSNFPTSTVNCSDFQVYITNKSTDERKWQ